MSPDASRKATFVTHEDLFQFRVMPFGLCNAPASFERLMDRVLSGMRWSRCLVYLNEVISFCTRTFEQFRIATESTFMQTEVAFLGYIVGRAGLACDPVKLSAIRAWHTPGSVKEVHQFIGFVGYYGRFIQKFAELSEPLVALTRKGTVFAWTSERQDAFEALKSCLLQALILGFHTEADRLVLDMDASLFTVSGVLNQIQGEQEVVIAYASQSLCQSPRRYCTTRRGNVSCCYNVYSFTFLSSGCSVHSAHISPVTSMASNVSQ